MILGVLSIIAGVFVFTQASKLNTLSVIATSLANISSAFTITAVCLVVSGVLAVVHSNKPSKKLLLGCALCNGIVAVTSFAIPVGDLQLWRYICFFFCVYYLIRAFDARLQGDQKSNTDIETTLNDSCAENTFVDPDLVGKAPIKGNNCKEAGSDSKINCENKTT